MCLGHCREHGADLGDGVVGDLVRERRLLDPGRSGVADGVRAHDGRGVRPQRRGARSPIRQILRGNTT